jgi:hypothetical protein
MAYLLAVMSAVSAGASVLATTLVLYMIRDKKRRGELDEAKAKALEERLLAMLADLAEQLSGLRVALVSIGAVERQASLPAAPSEGAQRAALAIPEQGVSVHVPSSKSPKPPKPPSAKPEEGKTEDRAAVPPGDTRITKPSQSKPRPALPQTGPINTRTAARIDALFWAKLTLAAQEGIDCAHCEGLDCDHTKATCDCTCAPCDRRRGLYESATVEIMGPQTAAERAERDREQPPGLADRVERLWKEKVAAAQEAGKNAWHCYEASCMPDSDQIAYCGCKCDGCTLVLDLLLQAQREILGSVIVPPSVILRQQAETWTKRNNGGIVAEVEPAQTVGDRLAFWFAFVVPSLDKYRHRLFRIEYGVDPYPVRIASGRSYEGVTEVRDEEHLYAAIQRILTAPETLKVVDHLRSMIAGKR